MDTDLVVKSKPVKVLRLLLKGAIIQDQEGRRWTMTEDRQIGILAVKEGSAEEVVLICDFTLTGFIGWAERLPDAAIIIAAGDVALNEMRRGQ